MKTTLKERSMAFMNCSWKTTARCNLICETCLYSSPEGFKPLFDDIKRRLEQREISEVRNGRV